MLRVDINCDMGEGMANDALLMPYITSANIACGYHAGDSQTMQHTIHLALQHGVAIGAHPGFNDQANFGRTEMQLTDEEVYQLVFEQVEALRTMCVAAHVAMHHVKPHGALYNMAARQPAMAAAIAQAVADVDARLILYGLSGSHLISQAQNAGLRTASEVFADRTYQADGSLTPRTQPNALIATQAASVAQALQMVQQQTVTTTNGQTIALKADTLCLHGDGHHAVDFAKAIHQHFMQHQIHIATI